MPRSRFGLVLTIDYAAAEVNGGAYAVTVTADDVIKVLSSNRSTTRTCRGCGCFDHVPVPHQTIRRPKRVFANLFDED